MQQTFHQMDEETAAGLFEREGDYTRQLEAALAPFAAVGRALEDECHDPDRPVFVFVVGMRGKITSLVVRDWLRAGQAGGGG